MPSAQIELSTDFTALLAVLLPFAQQMLHEYGEFFPFGATMNTNGSVDASAASSVGDHPDSRDVLQDLVAASIHSARMHEIRAAGICFDARVLVPGEMKKRDAIGIKLAHVNGEAVDVFVPYAKRWLRGVRYEEPFADAGTFSIAPE